MSISLLMQMLTEMTLYIHPTVQEEAYDLSQVQTDDQEGRRETSLPQTYKPTPLFPAASNSVQPW